MNEKLQSALIYGSAGILLFGLGWFSGTMYTNQRWNAKIASAPVVVTHDLIPQSVQTVQRKPAVQNKPKPILKPATVNVETNPSPIDMTGELIDENVLYTVKYDSVEVPGLRFLYLYFFEPPKLAKVDYQLSPRDSVTVTRTVLREPTIGEYLKYGLYVGGVTYVVIKLVYYFITGKIYLP